MTHRDPLFSIATAALKCIKESHCLVDLLTNLVDVDSLLSDKAWEALDLTELPTFGGDTIAPQAGVWSWDAERVLVSAWLTGGDDALIDWPVPNAAGFVLVTREQFAMLAKEGAVP